MSKLVLTTEAIPKQFLRRYRVVEVLNSTGWGKTYIAVDTHKINKPKCVIKQIQPVSKDPDCLQTTRRLFNREVQLLETLGHHNQIPQLLDYLEVKQVFYLVQEFVPGQPLSEELSPGHCWNEQQVIQFFHQVLNILAFVHSRGIIHGDLQPDKIIRRASDGRLVLTGFNALNQVRSQILTIPEQLHATVPLGALEYMAMEQVRGQPRCNSDIYALGMIGIQALTGLHPLQLEEDPKTGEVAWRHQATVSDKLAAIVTQMVRYHFKERYQSASDVLKALQGLERSHSFIQSAIAFSFPEPPVTSDSETATDSGSREARVSESEVFCAGEKSSVPFSIREEECSPAAKTPLLPLSPVPLLKADHLEAEGRRQKAGEIYPDASGMSIGPTDRDLLVQAPSKSPIWGHSFKGVANPSSYETSCLLPSTSCLLQSTVSKPTKASAKTFSQRISPTAAGFSAIIALALAVGGSYLLLLQALYRYAVSDPEQDILAQATQKYQAGQLQEAVAIAQSISPESTAYQDAQAAMQQWQQDWKNAEAQFETVKKVAAERQWRDVLTQARQMPKIAFWQQQIQPIVEQAQAQLEPEANQLLQQAYNLAAERNFTDALDKLQQIPEGTKAYTQIQPKIAEYTQKRRIKADYLLQQAYNQAAEKDFTSALAYLEQVPKDTAAYATAQQKIREYTQKQHIRANYLLQQGYNRAILKDFAGALAYLKQVPENTPAYAIAEQKIVQYTHAAQLHATAEKAASTTSPTQQQTVEQSFKPESDTPSSSGNQNSLQRQSSDRVETFSENLNPGSQLREVAPQVSLILSSDSVSKEA